MRVSQEVMSVLDRATCDGNALSLTALGQLDRKLYTDTNKVLEAAGGKWNRKAQAHLFEGPASDAIEPIILTGEVVSIRQEFQQFDTPPNLAQRVAAEAEIVAGMLVLEPSIGLGNIAVRVAAAGGLVTGYEIDLTRATKAHVVVPTARISVADFPAVEPEAIYDRVVMNPPFTKSQDIAHVEHALRFVKPGGRLVAIMSGGLLYRKGRVAAFRERITAMGGTITPLPADSFKASGTSVNTVLVVIDL